MAFMTFIHQTRPTAGGLEEEKATAWPCKSLIGNYNQAFEIKYTVRMAWCGTLILIREVIFNVYTIQVNSSLCLIHHNAS
jgi:hypothetical protein